MWSCYKPSKFAIAASCAAVLHVGVCSLLAQEVVDQQPKSLEKINESTYKLGEITMDTKLRTISFHATSEITDKLIEYVLVNPEGKIHEALFITKARPINLNIAFKLLGYKQNKSLFREFINDLPTERYQTATDQEKAHSYFTISINWTDTETKKRYKYNINELIQNTRTEKTLDQAKNKNIWSYGGSFMHQGKFAAELNHDIIAIFTDRTSLANYAGKGKEDDTLWFPVTHKMPAYGTTVNIVLTPQFPSKKIK